MKALVIAPHADDEAFGMGGTIAKLVSRGHDVHSVVVTCGEGFGFNHLNGEAVSRDVRLKELEAVSKLFGSTHEMLRFTEESKMDTLPIRDIVGEIESVHDRFKPDRWYVAGPSVHQDHRVVFEAAMTAARISRRNTPKEVYLYELPMYVMNHEPWVFKPNAWEDISDFLDTKIRSTYMYKSQVRENGPLSPSSLKNWAIACGSECGILAAERFQIIRSVRG
jgi:LmbE family N-acetylglucosaminyl deacetylase